ncbi:MAG: 23S rRNA (uridine(2552)-2'-O)-methyltransferase [Methanotrichaceae archaeon]|nr:23S rRNA (uridine(2552)-2'-O)-methyltransferase [Methanotrichaceae archaeon]
MARDQKDHYYRRAKEEGYRARSAYKLQQINQKFHLIKRGDAVVDLGAAPGGWLQIVRKLSCGKVVGVDLEDIEPISGVIILKADLTKNSTIDLVRESLEGKADVVISDAAPNLTGAWDLDHARSIDLARSALGMAISLLKPRGNFLVKVFQGDMFADFISDVHKEFSNVKAYSPPASRKESAETYVVAKKLLSGPVRKGDIREVTIDAIGKSGDGIAMIEGFAVIVKGANLGEKLKIRVNSVKSNFAFADII